MNKLSLWKKVILFTCIFSTLFSTFVFSVGATGVSDIPVTSFVSPIAFPSSAVCFNNGSSFSVLFDSNVTEAAPASGITNSYTRVETFGSDGLSFEGSISTSVNGTPYTGYSIPYFQGTASFSNTDILNNAGEDVNRLQLLISDFYVPGNLANTSQNAWNWLGNWVVTNYYDEPILASRYRLRYSVKYVDLVNSTFVLKSKNFDYNVDQSVLTNSQNMFENIRSTIRGSLPIGAPSRGVYFEYITLTFYDVDFIDGFSYGGSCKYITAVGGGGSGAINQWSSYFSSAAPVRQSSILGSIADGLRDVFSLKIFGEFTLGTLFSVMVAIPLTIWILKLFAGG